MNIFIGNLPADSTFVELKELLGEREVHTRFEQRMGRDRFDRDYHFLVVHTESNQAGMALIEQLNGITFKEHRITARGYVERSTSSGWSGEDRRINPLTSE
jgi:RNA recognition motif-containing protein